VNVVCGDFESQVHYFVIVFDLTTSTADALLLSPIVSTIQARDEDRHRLIRRSRL
jgi:hypothetical protein